MGESKRRRNLDQNYGKPQLVNRESLYYISTFHKAFILQTLQTWRQTIKRFPKILTRTHEKFLTSRFAVANKITRKTISVEAYTDLVLNTYTELENYIERKQINSLSIRLLKDRKNTPYSISVISPSKSLVASKSHLLNQEMAWLDFFIVAPSFLCQGIGTVTLQYITAELGDRIAAQIYIDSAGFFEKSGFDLEIYRSDNDADFYIAQNLSSDLGVIKKEVLFREDPQKQTYLSTNVAYSDNIAISEIVRLISREYPGIDIAEILSAS
jgi:hypothetical protein